MWQGFETNKALKPANLSPNSFSKVLDVRAFRPLTRPHRLAAGR